MKNLILMALCIYLHQHHHHRPNRNWAVLGHNEFTADGCLSMHNKLRERHTDTNPVTYDKDLEKSARQSAEFLNVLSGGTETDGRPTRELPKKRRRRRHVDDVNKDVHIESWDGDIYYPDSKIPKENRGESIHKMCCTTKPHCPKEFFHGLLFPPSAEGVVKDFYDEEIDSYDFTSGQKKTQYFTQIKHFTNVVWKKTTKVGCFQTPVNSLGCVYTVIHYQEKGSQPNEPDVFKANVGDLIVAGEDSKVLLIFLIVFFIVLFVLLLVMCYCCRSRIREKYYKMKIKADTLKAEQELETDSTAFWWLKIFKRNRRSHKRPTRTRSTKHHQSLREQNISIEVIHNIKPQRSIKQQQQQHRARGQSNAQSFAIKYQGISQKAKRYGPDETIYENTQQFRQQFQQRMQNEEQQQDEQTYDCPENQPSHPRVTRELSFSGKPPPAVPTPQQRPNPTNRPNKAKLAKPLMPPPPAPIAAPRPNPHPSTAPKPTQSFKDSDNNSTSVNELRNKFNNQQGRSGGGAPRALPPVKTKPLMPPKMPPTFKPR